MIIRAEGGIHGNLESSHYQRFRHTDPTSGIATNPTLTRIGGLREGKAFKKSGSAIGQQASEDKITTRNSLPNFGLPPSLSEGRLLYQHGFDFNLD